MPDVVGMATTFAKFLKELGITDPYVILILVAMFLLGTVMAWNNWFTMRTIKSSNRDTSKAQSETIALLKEHHKICVDQHKECKEGQDKLHQFITDYILKGDK